MRCIGVHYNSCMKPNKYGPTPKPIGERFWTKVRKTRGCWEWTGSKNRDGYGNLLAGSAYPDRQFVRAHRVSWELHVGPIGELFVLHKCDNPSCVRPDHLYLGTQQKNVKDRATRRRGKEHRQFGEANDNAKLSDADVRAIKELLKSSRPQREIAEMFGVKQPQISRIKLGTSRR